MRYSVDKLDVIARTMLVGCSLSFVAWALFWPVVRPSSDAVFASDLPAAGPVADPPSAMETVAIDVVWKRRLQAHLVGKPPAIVSEPPKTTSQPPPSQQIDVVLIGTMLEENNSFATIADGSGRMDTQPVGAELQLAPNGMLVESVSSGSAVIRYQGFRYELRLQASQAIRSGLPSNADALQGTPKFESLDDELDWLNSPADDGTAGQMEGLNVAPTSSQPAATGTSPSEDASEMSEKRESP